MYTLCVVGSGKKKVWDARPNCGPQRVQDVYLGPFTRKCITYAALFYPSSWCVLSPKYGFLLPDEQAYVPACAKFDQRETSPLSIEKLTMQARILDLDQYSSVELLASQAYLNVVRGIFPHMHIKSPLLGLHGIGTMISAITEAIEANVPLT